MILSAAAAAAVFESPSTDRMLGAFTFIEREINDGPFHNYRLVFKLAFYMFLSFVR